MRRTAQQRAALEQLAHECKPWLCRYTYIAKELFGVVPSASEALRKALILEGAMIASGDQNVPSTRTAWLADVAMAMSARILGGPKNLHANILRSKLVSAREMGYDVRNLKRPNEPLPWYMVVEASGLPDSECTRVFEESLQKFMAEIHRKMRCGLRLDYRESPDGYVSTSQAQRAA